MIEVSSIQGALPIHTYMSFDKHTTYRVRRELGTWTRFAKPKSATLTAELSSLLTKRRILRLQIPMGNSAFVHVGNRAQ